MKQRTLLPDKLFFKIGEVAEIVGVEPHALRYWESEFAALRPKKTRGAHRQYSRKDVELAMLIKQLLHDEGFTISGARKKIRELGREHLQSSPEPRVLREVALRAELAGLRDMLTNLMQHIGGGDAAPALATGAAGATNAAPSSSDVRQLQIAAFVGVASTNSPQQERDQ